MNKLVFLFAGALISAPLFASTGQPVWPADAQEKNDSRVLAFYDAQCAQYADRNELSGDARQAFDPG